MSCLALLILVIAICPAAHAGSATPSFHDAFSTFTPGAKWDWLATDSPLGRGGPKWGEMGDQWWVNPTNPHTPISGLYKDAGGMLHLGLKVTPRRYQAYVDTHAGRHLPYVGTLLNNQRHGLQTFGFYSIKVAVDRVPGFAFLSSIEAHPVGPWPPEIDLLIFTDADHVQWVKFAIHTSTKGGPVFRKPSGDGFDPSAQHTYAWDWQRDHITFYIDGAEVFRTPTPKVGRYTGQPMFMYLATYANYTGPDPSRRSVKPAPSKLPAYAHIDDIRVYRSRPPAPGSN